MKKRKNKNQDVMISAFLTKKQTEINLEKVIPIISTLKEIGVENVEITKDLGEVKILSKTKDISIEIVYEDGFTWNKLNWKGKINDIVSNKVYANS
jgi:hypothetical protein